MKNTNKEKKIKYGILSFNMNTRFYNFGAALHSYAFQQYLNKYNTENIIINYNKGKIFNLIKFLIKKYKYNFFNVLIKNNKKKKIFTSFFNKNCITTKKKYTPKNFESLKHIETYICETDVIWTRFKGGYDRAFMCDYKNQKGKDNVAYSVDFGSSLLKEKYENELREYSKNFKYISIRNVFKLDYIKKVLNREDIIVTIDPVFLLEKEDYKKIIKKANIDKDYVFVYNCKENHPELLKQAQKYANENNLYLKIVNCYDKNINSINDDNPTVIGIEEFLGYIKYANCIFTNSYHGICFSIIFEKEFYAFSRTANNEKILTVLNIFGLEHRFIQYDNFTSEKINYSHVWNKSNKLINDSKEFIHRSIIKESTNI